MTSASPPAAAPTQHPERPARPWLAAVTVAAVLALVGVFAVGIYRWGWRGPVVSIVTKVLPFPAAIVDGSAILWSDYQGDVTALERFYQAQRARAAAGSVFPSAEEIRTRVLDRLIRDRLAENLAARYGLEVSYAEVRQAYEQSLNSGLASAASRAAAELQTKKTLDDLYGLSTGDYQARMLRPLLIRQKLEAKLQQDDQINADKMRKAEAAAAELRAGRDFGETAVKYSEDPNVSVSRGERGLVGPGIFPAEVDAALVRASAGDVIGPIKSSLGYHVLKVGEIKVEAGVRRAEIKEIVVYPVRLDDWLEARLKEASVIIFAAKGRS